MPRLLDVLPSSMLQAYLLKYWSLPPSCGCGPNSDAEDPQAQAHIALSALGGSSSSRCHGDGCIRCMWVTGLGNKFPLFLLVLGLFSQEDPRFHFFTAPPDGPLLAALMHGKQISPGFSMLPANPREANGNTWYTRNAGWGFQRYADF